MKCVQDHLMPIFVSGHLFLNDLFDILISRFDCSIDFGL